MSPSAIDRELDLTLKAVGNVAEGDLPNVLGNLGHLVHSSVGLPGFAIQPSAFAVTGCINALVNKLCVDLNDVARYIGVVLNRIVNYGKGAGACQVKGHIVAVLVADPLSAVLNGLELYILVLFVNSVILGVGAVIVLGHEVGLIGAIPTGAENLSLAARYDVIIISNRSSCFSLGCLRRRSCAGSRRRTLGGLSGGLGLCLAAGHFGLGVNNAFSHCLTIGNYLSLVSQLRRLAFRLRHSQAFNIEVNSSIAACTVFYLKGNGYKRQLAAVLGAERGSVEIRAVADYAGNRLGFGIDHRVCRVRHHGLVSLSIILENITVISEFPLRIQESLFRLGVVGHRNLAFSCSEVCLCKGSFTSVKEVRGSSNCQI